MGKTPCEGRSRRRRKANDLVASATHRSRCAAGPGRRADGSSQLHARIRRHRQGTTALFLTASSRSNAPCSRAWYDGVDIKKRCTVGFPIASLVETQRGHVNGHIDSLARGRFQWLR